MKHLGRLHCHGLWQGGQGSTFDDTVKMWKTVIIGSYQDRSVGRYFSLTGNKE